jgi:hypothetical protein
MVLINHHYNRSSPPVTADNGVYQYLYCSLAHSPSTATLEGRLFIIPRQIGEKDYLRSCSPEDVFRKCGRYSSA